VRALQHEELRGWWLALNASDEFIAQREQHTLAFYVSATASELSDALAEARLRGNGCRDPTRCTLLKQPCFTWKRDRFDGEQCTWLWLGGHEGSAGWSVKDQLAGHANREAPPRPSTARMVTRGEPTILYRPPRYAPRYARTTGCGAMTMVFGAMWVRRDTGPCAGVVSGSWGPSVVCWRHGDLSACCMLGVGAFVFTCSIVLGHGVPWSACSAQRAAAPRERECERTARAHATHGSSRRQLPARGCEMRRQRAARSLLARVGAAREIAGLHGVDVSLCVAARTRRAQTWEPRYKSRHIQSVPRARHAASRQSMMHARDMS
jgi:hypothetical protein